MDDATKLLHKLITDYDRSYTGTRGCALYVVQQLDEAGWVIARKPDNSKRPRGIDHTNAKLTDGQVKDIRDLRRVNPKSRMTIAQIAETYNVSKSLIEKILSGARRSGA